MRSKRAFTLLEMMIASAIFATVMVIVLMVMMSTARPVAQSSIRADLTNQGRASMNEMVRDLEGATNIEIGNYTTVGGFVPDATDYDGGADEVQIGRAIRFQRVLDYTTTPTLEAPQVFAFQRISPLRVALIRVLPSGDEITITQVIQEEGGLGTPGTTEPDMPRFRLTTPSRLQINFTMERGAYYEQSTLLRIPFERTIFLRNMTG